MLYSCHKRNYPYEEGLACAYCLHTHELSINWALSHRCCCDGSVGVFLETTFDKCPVHTGDPHPVVSTRADADIHNSGHQPLTAASRRVLLSRSAKFRKQRKAGGNGTVNKTAAGHCSGRGLAFSWMSVREMWGSECQHLAHHESLLCSECQHFRLSSEYVRHVNVSMSLISS